MIQDLGAKVFDNSFKNIAPGPDDTILVFDEGDVLIRGTPMDGISFPKRSEIPDNGGTYQYLFSIDSKPFFMLLDDIHPTVKGCHWDNVKVLRCDKPRELCFAGYTGFQLYTWRRENIFCGHCGTKLVHEQKERALRCPKCGQSSHPKVKPAVSVAVTDGDRLLITRYNHRTYRGTSLVSGFCEIGETPEQAAAREVRQEVGLEIKNLSYYQSQPWGKDSVLIMGFFAEVDGSTDIVRQEDELSEAKWIKASDLPLEVDPINLEHHMMQDFRSRFVDANGRPLKK